MLLNKLDSFQGRVHDGQLSHVTFGEDLDYTVEEDLDCTVGEDLNLELKRTVRVDLNCNPFDLAVVTALADRCC